MTSRTRYVTIEGFEPLVGEEVLVEGRRWLVLDVEGIVTPFQKVVGLRVYARSVDDDEHMQFESMTVTSIHSPLAVPMRPVYSLTDGN